MLSYLIERMWLQRLYSKWQQRNWSQRKKKKLSNWIWKINRLFFNRVKHNLCVPAVNNLGNFGHENRLHTSRLNADAQLFLNKCFPFWLIRDGADTSATYLQSLICTISINSPIIGCACKAPNSKSSLHTTNCPRNHASRHRCTLSTATIAIACSAWFILSQFIQNK